MPRPKKVVEPVKTYTELPDPAPKKAAPVAPPVVEKKSQPVSTFVVIDGKEWTFLQPFVGEIKSVGVPFDTEDFTFVELNGNAVVAVKG